MLQLRHSYWWQWYSNIDFMKWIGDRKRGGNEIVKEKRCIWSYNRNGQNKNIIILVIMILLQVVEFHIQSKNVWSPDRGAKDLQNFILKQTLKERSKIVATKPLYFCTHWKKNDFKDLHHFAYVYINISKLNISQVFWVNISKNNHFTVSIRKSFSDVAPWDTCNVPKK